MYSADACVIAENKKKKKKKKTGKGKRARDHHGCAKCASHHVEL